MDFLQVVASLRTYNSGTHAGLANIPSNGTVDISVDTKVKSCSNLTNDVSAVWRCGAGACLAAVTAKTSVDLQLKNPLLSYTPPSITVDVPYCSSAVVKPNISFTISHNALSTGDATNVSLKVDFGSTFQIDAVSSPVGAI